MSRQSVSVNLDRPANDWKKVRGWYKVLSFICAGIIGYAVFRIGISSTAINILFAFIAFLTAYLLGIAGGVIAAGIRYFIQPRSIRLYGNPNSQDILNVKIYWMIMPLAGVLFGSLFGPLLILFPVSQILQDLK